MKIIKKMTPLMMATMVLAPSLLIDSTYAQASREVQEQVVLKKTEKSDEVIQLQNVEKIFRSYIGTRSFKVEDDAEVKRYTQQFNQQHKNYEQAAKLLSEKKSALSTAQKQKKNLETQITNIEKEIVKALSAKTNLESKLPTLQRQLQTSRQQAQVAQKALDATQADLNQINSKITQAQKELKNIQESCSATPSPKCTQDIKKAQAKVTQETRPKAAAQRLFNIAKKDLETKNKNTANKQKELNESKAKIATLETENTQRAQTLNQKNQEIKVANQKVNAATKAIQPVQADYNRKLELRNKTAAGINRLKETIAIRAVRLNKIGAEVASEAGSVDGDYYAEYIGLPQGQRDGDRDGRESGTSAGQNNSFNQGMAQGEVEGRSQGQIDGFDHGKDEGTKAALITVATQVGQRDGLQRAQDSDASSVGTQQGQAAGLDRSIQTGKKVGTQKGEAAAIKENESDATNSTIVSGQFAGTFAARTPSYPGFNCIKRGNRRYTRDQYEWRNYNDWNSDLSICPNFKPREHSEMARADRDIFKAAFMDGYLVRYRGSRREQFVRSIDHYYSPSYNNSRNAAFSEYSTRNYPGFLEKGRQQGYTTAYNSTYPSVKDRYYNEFYASSISNPDTTHPQYTTTYRQVESNNYATQYEQLRADAYNTNEQSTFDQNIKAQTEKFTKIRFDEVNSIYANHSVLKYESASIVDAGINDVAVNDGIYKPGENIIHNITLKNFGSVAATEAKVKINGQMFKLPAIAAKSEVTIKGAAVTTVDAKLGQVNDSTIEVISALTSQASIQGRHYYSTSTGRLNFGDKKSVTVKYPISLAGLRTKTDLLMNKKNSLQLNASNISNRKYTGKLEIELNVDAKSEVITKSFDALDGLTGSVTLNDAEVLITNEEDVYSSLNFSAKIKKDGVTIGVLPGTYRTMAKAPFTDKAGQPVILADSDKSADDLIKVISSYGGISKVSVLDTTLDALNSKVYTNGLDKKSIIVIDDTRGSTVANVSKLLKKLEDSSVVYVDYSARGLSQALAKSAQLKHAAKLPNLIDGISNTVNLHYTNQYIDGTADMNVIAQANFENYKEMVAALSQFNYTKNEIIPAAGSALSSSNYMRTNSKIRTMISMAAGEVVNASLAYSASGENQNLVKFIESDAPIYKRILAQSGKKVSKKTLSKNMAAIAMWKVLDKAVDSFDPMDDNVDYDIESPFEDAMKDMMQGEGLRIFSKGTWNYLKSYDKGLYNTIDDNPYIHSPFKL